MKCAKKKKKVWFFFYGLSSHCVILMAVWGVLIHEGQSKTSLEAKAWKARVHPLMIFLDFYYAWKCGQVICADICISNSGVSYLNDRVVQCVQQRDHTHEGLCFKNLPVKKQFKFKNLLWRNRSANKTRTCGAEMRGTYLAVQPLYLFPPLLSMASLGWAPEAQHNSLLAFDLLSAPYSSASVYECMVAIEALWIPPEDELYWFEWLSPCLRCPLRSCAAGPQSNSPAPWALVGSIRCCLRDCSPASSEESIEASLQNVRREVIRFTTLCAWWNHGTRLL